MAYMLMDVHERVEQPPSLHTSGWTVYRRIGLCSSAESGIQGRPPAPSTAVLGVSPPPPVARAVWSAPPVVALAHAYQRSLPPRR